MIELSGMFNLWDKPNDAGHYSNEGYLRLSPMPEDGKLYRTGRSTPDVPSIPHWAYSGPVSSGLVKHGYVSLF